VTVCVTEVAALNNSFPACDAEIEHVPAPTIVIVAPFVPPEVQTSGVVLANETVRAVPAELVPLAVALTVKAESPYVLVPTEDVEKEIVCDALEMVND